MAEVDYESLPVSSTAAHMLAGAIAGITEHTVMYPLDSIKTRMQVLAAPPIPAMASTSTSPALASPVYSSLSRSMQRMVTTEGLRSLWKGIGSVIVGAGPAHAMYFGTYELVKDLTGGNRQGHQFLSTAVAGSAATFASDAFMNPFDVIKQRMQMGSHTNLLNAARTIYLKEGLSAFYVSLPTTLTITVPFNAIQFSTYEYAKAKLNPDAHYSPSTHIMAGGLAGGLAAAVTTPLDVAKTLLQTRGTSADPAIRGARGLFDAFRIINARHGAAGFTRGLSARVMFNVPSTAVCWATYEMLKVFIKGE